MTSGKGEANTRPPREFANASFLLVPAAELCKSGMPDSRILELFNRCSVLVVVVLHHVTTVVDGRTIFADVHGCLRGIRLTQWTRDRLLEGSTLLDLQEQGYRCMDGLFATIEGSGIDIECALSPRAHLGTGVCICMYDQPCERVV